MYSKNWASSWLGWNTWNQKINFSLNVLAGRLKPNWMEILTYFQGSELQNYFHVFLKVSFDQIYVVVVCPFTADI